MQLCSNKTLFTETGREPDLACRSYFAQLLAQSTDSGVPVIAMRFCPMGLEIVEILVSFNVQLHPSQVTIAPPIKTSSF